MAIEKVRAYLAQFGMESQILEFETSSATVELAAQAVGVAPARIAKTLSFATQEGCLLLVTAGDTKIDNTKFKAAFGMKAKMLAPDAVLALTGHAVGGVCPFGVDAPVYLDRSLRRFDIVYPACGSSNSAIALTCEQLTTLSRATDWVDVCKGWQEETE